MNTIASSISGNPARRGVGRDEKFFFISAIVMTVVLVAGFAAQLATGRSTFASPARVHIHALVFFGWVVLYMTQNALAATGSLALHRRLGWLATAWLPLMIFSGTWMTVAGLQSGKWPPFFQPAYFLVMNVLSIWCFAGLAAAAVVKRRDTQWHRRLMLCGMAAIMGPGFGRLLPMPFIVPWAGFAAFACGLLFVFAGMIRDLRKEGRVHPAWWWGLGVLVGTDLIVETLPHTALGISLYEAVVSGHPAAPPAMEFGPLPPR
jgi:hypothetical protein